MLVSSGFLYEREIDAAHNAKVGDFVSLTSAEVARRLAAFVWQSVPDDALLALGEQGQLATADQVAAEARLMIGTAATPNAKAERGVRAFADQWLNLDHTRNATKDGNLYPGFSPQLAASMAGETEAFFAEVILHDDARYETLLTANWTMMDANVAAIYGLPGLDGTTFVRVPLPPERSGLITQPAFLAGYSQFAFSSPTIRGHFLRSKLMCRPIDPPPNPAVAANPPMPPDGGVVDVRDLYIQHADESCAYCHDLMDPMGFAFEAFDTTGKYVPIENKHPAITTGAIKNIDAKGTNVDVTGAIDLAQKLATSAAAQDCFVRQMFRFAMVRVEDDSADSSSLGLAEGVFDTTGHDIRQLMAALTASDAFRLHLVKDGEPVGSVHPSQQPSQHFSSSSPRPRTNVGGSG